MYVCIKIHSYIYVGDGRGEFEKVTTLESWQQILCGPISWIGKLISGELPASN